MLLAMGGTFTALLGVHGASIDSREQKKPTTWTTPSGQKLQAPKWATTVYDQIQYSFYNLYQLDETLPKNRKKLEKLHQKAQDLEAYITVLDHKDQPDPAAKVEYLKKRPITTTQTIIESGSVMTSTGTTALQKPKKSNPLTSKKRPLEDLLKKSDQQRKTSTKIAGDGIGAPIKRFFKAYIETFDRVMIFDLFVYR